jgi:hypothetical protein
VTVNGKVGLLILSLALANLAIWGAKTIYEHGLIDPIARALGG